MISDIGFGLSRFSGLIERSSRNHQPSGLLTMKEDLFKFFWILFEKCIRRCRVAPLSFHPWSWWDVRERLTLGRAQFISPSIFPSLQYTLPSCTRSSIGLHCSAISPAPVSMGIIWMEAREGSQFSRAGKLLSCCRPPGFCGRISATF